MRRQCPTAPWYNAGCRTVKTETCRLERVHCHFRSSHTLNSLTDWESKWQMKFNYAKCHMMHISQLRDLRFHYRYVMNSHQLEEVNSYPYLGVEISSDLRWNIQVDKAVKKASQSLGMLRRNISGCSRSTKELAYNSLVRPRLEYASSVWDPHTDCLKTSLEAVQRRAARFVRADYSRYSSVAAMLDKLKWEPLEIRRRRSRLILFYKAVNVLMAVPTDELKHPQRPTRRCPHPTCHFTELHSNTDTLRYSFFHRTIRDWNNLPDEIIKSSSIDKFKKAIFDPPSV